MGVCVLPFLGLEATNYTRCGGDYNSAIKATAHIDIASCCSTLQELGSQCAYNGAPFTAKNSALSIANFFVLVHLQG